MARIVLVHGAFNELGGPNTVRSRWLPALRDGLWLHDVTIDDDEVDVAFYGDLFRFDPESDDPVRLEAARGEVREAFAALAGDGALEALGDAVAKHAADRAIDMFAILGQRPTLNDAILPRFERVIGPETRVIVAHSLGTVISYLALLRHPEWGVPNLITMGSPLATDAVFSTLTQPTDPPAGTWPATLQRWVNVASIGDPAVAGTRVADRFGDRVEEREVDNGHRAHDPEPYLSASATGLAIAEALRD